MFEMRILHIVLALLFLLTLYVTADDVRDKEWCITNRDKYEIKPGKSFGKLPVNMHSQYLNMKCHRFFCKPHPMAGKGVYDCEPLE